MKNRIFILQVSVCSLFLFSNISRSSAQSYTWAENAACIFYTNCTPCHYPGGPGPFSLLDYGSAFTARFAIKQAVLDGYMPPWPADPNYRSLAHERLLTQEEKDVLVGWVDGGGVQGNLANAPTTPIINTGSELATIDFTGSIGTYTNPAPLDDYRCFVIPGVFATDQYITDIEIIPGNRAMVHHVVIFADTSSQILALDAGDPGPGYTSFGGSGSSTSKMVAVWAPGTGVKSFPNGMGVKIMAGSRIILQLHYPQGTDGDTDSTRINFTYAGGVVRELFIQTVLNHADLAMMSEPLIIPPNTVKSFTQSFTIPDSPPSLDSFSVFSIFPHMHKVGKSMKVYKINAITLDTVPLIDIPAWDFKWQLMYDFRQPIVVKEFDTFGAYAVYDNTSANTNAPNPNDSVFSGEATAEEMMVTLMYYAVYQPGDENMVIDTSTVKPMYNGCTFVGIEEQINANAKLQLYPNPTGYDFYIRYDQLEASDLSIKIIDITGRVVFQMVQPEVEVGSYIKNVPVENLVPGTYMVQIANKKGVSNKSLVIIR